MRLLRLLSGLVLAATALDLATLVARWVAVPHLAHGPVPRSRFMAAYLKERAGRGGPPLRWRPVPLTAIAPALRRAVVLGEDATFYRNDGFDVGAILSAARYDWHAGHIVYGASTITQQTAKKPLPRSVADLLSQGQRGGFDDGAHPLPAQGPHPRGLSE